MDKTTLTTLKVILPGEAGWFYLYKAVRGDRATCAASPAAAVARMEAL